MYNGLGISLTNNEIKDFIKVINSLENREILLKGTTTRTTSQKGGFLNFFRPLMTTNLPLMKNLLISLVKSLLVPLGLTTESSATETQLFKRKFLDLG